MLKQLIDILNKNGYYIEKNIHEIPKTCCENTPVKVLDFDTLKEIFYANINKKNKNKGRELLEYPQSVDALLISAETDQLFLIEMKKYEPSKDNNTTLSPEEFIRCHFRYNNPDSTSEEKISSNIVRKINESVTYVLFRLVNHYSMGQEFIDYFLNRCRIIPIMLVNLNDEELSDAQISTMDLRTVEISRSIKPEIELMNCELFKETFMNRYA